MLDVKELRAAMVRKGYTQQALARELGISEQTLTRKIKKGVFGTDEAQKITIVLEIPNPARIFFAQQVT